MKIEVLTENEEGRVIDRRVKSMVSGGEQVMAPSEAASFIKCDCNSQSSFIKRESSRLLTFIKCDIMCFE